MPVPLEQWQARLEGHFTQLAASRSQSRLPLFALEHGLSETDIEELDHLLCLRMRSGLTSRPLWLAWVVLATEYGYGYDGGEYWHPIEARTGPWDLYQRRQLRVWFQTFQKSYGGVIPTGAWAAWFSIIAWPITHSILPKYLQWQFARALYDLRYRLASLDSFNPAAVGRLFTENAWYASSRFREFLQQEVLVGRLVLALLTDEEIGGESPIFDQTLNRVVADLEQVQNAGEWLRETRRYVADRLKGARRSVDWHATSAAIYAPDLRASPTTEDPNIKPALMLRRSGPTSWSIVVEMPSLAGLARLHPNLRTFLTNTRCKVPGAGDGWMPRGWLMGGPQKRVLRAWPGASGPLLSFERPHQSIEHLINREVRLSRGSLWICRVQSDGLAHEVTGRIVRPGQRYVVLSEAPLPSRNAMLAAAQVDCTGVRAGLLTIPSGVSIEDQNFLQGLGLQVARTVRIWPAGMVARGWDGEGRSEWLTTENPCFGIVHDHPVDAYSLRLDNGAEQIIAVGAVRHPTFVRLPALAPGRHTLAVKARRTQFAYSTPVSPPAEGVVDLFVREPEPWIPGTTAYAGLAVTLDPQDPSLDMFWQGEVSVSVRGPEGHQANCAITLINAGGKEILSEKIAIFDLPITGPVWHRKFNQFANDDNRAWAYLEATSARFAVSADELGEYRLLLERDVRPVHWVCRSAHKTATVRLIDDTGKDTQAACSFYSFAAPADASALMPESILAGQTVAPPGGLFIARHGEVQDTVIVSAPQIEHDLRGLVIEPNLGTLALASTTLESILEILLLWRNARVVGPLAGLRRSRVVARLANRVYGRICGNDWARTEAAFFTNPESASSLRGLETAVGGQPDFGGVLRRDYEKLESGLSAAAQWFTDVARRYGVSTDAKLCRFALRIASEPEHFLSLSESDRGRAHQVIADSEPLFRGARLVAVLAAARDHERSPNILPRWEWQ